MMQARQPVGIPTGGRFAPGTHAEPGFTLGGLSEPAGAGMAVENACSATRPVRPYVLAPSGEGFMFDEAGAVYECQHRVPANRSQARRALSAPRLAGRRGRVVDLGAMPGRTSSYLDDDYEVVGPSSGAPLIVRITSGFHRLHVRSGNVHVEVRHGFGGSVEVHGGSAGVAVDGANKFSVTVRDGARARVALSGEARVRVAAEGGTAYVTGGGPDCRLRHAPGGTILQDGPEEQRLPVNVSAP